MSKILFILKKREVTNDECIENPYCYAYSLSSGLKNSARFVVEMLHSLGIEAKIVEVADNNAIDREVYLYKPTHVIIEAIWVVPEKFQVLRRLHPNVKWIVRNHSELPFLAGEGNAIRWILEYVTQRKVLVATNSIRSYYNLHKLVEDSHSLELADRKLMLLPNYYQISTMPKEFKPICAFEPGDTINVGCFGAIRPMKNHVVQAAAAIAFVRNYGLNMNFHINVARIEDHGNCALKSLRAMFEKMGPSINLVEHRWLEHCEFLKLVKTMDVGLQVSFSESFNIVAADFVACGVPIVVSPEIFWMPRRTWADPTSCDSITKGLKRVMTRSWFHDLFFDDPTTQNLKALEFYNCSSKEIWEQYFQE